MINLVIKKMGEKIQKLSRKKELEGTLPEWK
jgi:hypothetical protein